ncbi:hypothetical protein RLEG3_15120 [Rhizobium leguminosarum bv. trifolii WSM1689]|nr:hypothetical protein RLEG3_15120 [Rhizobium leguminosarum bv. trifolii WSM1689]
MTGRAVMLVDVFKQMPGTDDADIGLELLAEFAAQSLCAAFAEFDRAAERANALDATAVILHFGGEQLVFPPGKTSP